ncbi:hypothetical protein HMPREF9630_00474 [Peptoanaerobacter stomatis]|uniref:Sulfatase N-terminal domain-containing protein n=1 Tax=Peptoanaerobacter stomatis TaxID=796937 RepID=V9HUG3_9FIRM|nr:LTA synthase family protein [Peptoanaerobacter stomatis]EHL17307.1 hypothetical protein HMPREF9630_00474 [Peptoanaerobacter stomatis]
MYVIYVLIASITMSFIYEYSGLNGIGAKNMLLSFLLFLFINILVSNPNKKYKRNIVIFSFIPVLLAICNVTKVRFQLAEISFFDVKLAKAAGDIAGLFLDKIPYTKIALILVVYVIFVILSKKYVDIIDFFKMKYTLEEQNDIDDKLFDIDRLFRLKYIKIFPLIFIISFFTFTSEISSALSTSSFGNLLISGKILTQTYLRKYENEEQAIKRIIKTAKKEELAKIDINDRLLKDYPFNKQNNMDVVIIQSETFFDLPKYQDKLEKNGIVVHDEHISDNLHYYQNNGISGIMHTPTVGGGTVNTEYEVMTGYGARYFARGSIVFTSILEKQTNSLAYFLKDYVGNMKTIGIHNHNADYWDRDRVYPLLGIDKFIDITMFTKEEQDDLVGAWMSDKTIFDMTRRQLEENPNTNNFILSVTVQNHGPFLGKKGEDIEVDNLSEHDGWEIRNFVSNLKYSDEQLKIFMDYIDSRQKPTIVIFYGDHKPDPNYDIFKNSKYYTENDRQNMFNTDYFIYFNNAVQDEKLTSLKGIHQDISAAALNRYIQILLGDTSPVSMYMYNYTKDPVNYFNKDVITGIKDNTYRDITTNFVNAFIDYKDFD